MEIKIPLAKEDPTAAIRNKLEAMYKNQYNEFQKRE